MDRGNTAGENYRFIRLFEIVGEDAWGHCRHGKAIIVGRGANIVLGPDGGFHVRITGLPYRRIIRIAERNKISLEDAREIVESSEAP